MNRQSLAITTKAAVVAWLLAPLLVAVARADEPAESDPDAEEGDESDESDEPGESPVDPEEPSSGAQGASAPGGVGAMPPGMMGHTPSMMDNSRIQEIRDAHGGGRRRGTRPSRRATGRT